MCRAEPSRPLPDFADIDLQDRALPDGILLGHLKAFQTLYREHCEVSHGHTHTDVNPVLCAHTWLIVLDVVKPSFYNINLFPPQAILDVMVNLQFTLVETLWKSFWRFSQSSDTESLNL